MNFLPSRPTTVTWNQFALVFDAISSGIYACYRPTRAALSIQPCLLSPDPSSLPVRSLPHYNGRNAKIRVSHIVTVLSAIFNWDNFVNRPNIDWKRAGLYHRIFFWWIKSKKCHLRLSQFHPVKHFLQKVKRDVEASCSFCEQHPENCFHFCSVLWFYTHCGKTFCSQQCFFSSDFTLHYKNVILMNIFSHHFSDYCRQQFL